jgi:hypothetical protein
MSFNTARRDIEKRLEANWATTPIAWENVAFSPPKEGDWIHLTIFEERVDRKTVNQPATHRVFGNISIDINTPINVGTATARTHGANIATIFRDQQFNGITCREATLSNGGDVQGTFRMTLSIPFYWDGIYP